MAIGWPVDWREIGGSCNYDYFLAKLSDKTVEGFENLVKEMERDGWKLVVEMRRGFTLIHNREQRIEDSLFRGVVPFERLKK